MYRLISSVALFAAALGAQQVEVVQLAPQDSGTPQIFEFHNGGFVSGGTYLGVNLAEIASDRARELKLKEAYGVEITRVEDGSPAEKAGLKSGDVVLEYSGQRVEGMEQFGRLVRETPPAREVKLLISRNGVPQTITATVQARKAKGFSAAVVPAFDMPDMPEIHIPDMPQIFTSWRSPVLGVEAEALGTQLAAYFGVKEGVLVRSVAKETAAEKAGIKAGDVITKVDGSAVTTPNELVSAVHSASSRKTFPVELMRDRHETTVTVTVEDRSERIAPRTRAVHNVKM
jgi:serine protease Do